ncbi:PTS galactosamine/N-acetylgalactosamine transporter subunit IIA [Providencia rettgeri]|uniref:PTS galactosamine/N-acetylgalactosamine transporter subunit IIA n=4 Tax=Providencia TaxID=586 RepID=A0ABT9AQQ7_9GAMM|nr:MULTISPECIES: PTS galactosamine/N-acetylgalactosamine transporter subunit IIA [Providencia]MDK3008493.1 PTS galactosamine/N-acetylgalactosamine transporter subunit IIA [Providencia rettgeri]MDO7831883.1 PTS galactosamine/N-acetylgalactosamine transporter subunit IIA [Providencia sp. CRE-138-0026]MDO7856162.1 PTS galactosamine/N-acetylgalactosamine transporter subunit IIA [Providencia sp. CRE-138-0111]MDR9615451.1 PTS galactosamine/N-acetylgalactosamine transporter subunit IIA [Providencia re
MIGLIISGHLNFASGMASAVKAIAGEQENMVFIDFIESISPDELEQQMRAAIQSMSCEQVVFLTDLPGGTPCNRAMAIMMENPSVEVLAGVNLPMIVNAAFEREDTTASELLSVLREIGMTSIQDLREQLAMSSEPENEEDGLWTSNMQF